MAEEKKEGSGFSGWWNKTKNNINSSILENNLENAFNKGNISFVNYNHKEYLLYNFEDIIKNYLKTIKEIYNIEDQIWKSNY